MKRTLEIYQEIIPENSTGDVSITIKAKKSELHQLPYDIRCVLYDAIDKHPEFRNVQIKDFTITEEQALDES